ncbi:TonB-dependent receptor plug domain-containing protein [Aeromonas diversa]|uniref:TonB-dependent receptor plug domain-containing protein n=1 Tax=Aeromonas diversa TaxID=502790 RepID=UPI0039A0256A
MQLQAYYDRRERELPGLFEEALDILDIELQHNLGWGERQAIVWGVGQRMAWDSVENGPLLQFLPADRRLHWSSLFVQDEILLSPTWRLTLGMRLEDNTYTGMEWMPSARLAWHLDEEHLWWASLARGVRTPSRLDREFYIPHLLDGGADFSSETVNTMELGYRGQAGSRASYSLSLFYSEYDDLRTTEPRNGALVISNGMEATIKGVEAWTQYRLTQDWQLMTGGLLMDEDLRLKPDSADAGKGTGGVNDPGWQWQLRLSGALSPTHDLDLSLRHVGALSTPDIPAYTTLDMNLNWRPFDALDLSLVGRNLVGPGHCEFGTQGSCSEFGRSLYLQSRYRF